MSNKQASFSTILSNNDESNNIHELPGQNMLDDVVLNVSSPPPLTQEEINNILKNQTDLSEMTECPVSHKKGNISSCPFMNSQNKDLRNTKFEYHYEVPLPETIQDFRFNITNYSKEGIENSKILRNMPRHLRNTIFIKNDKVEQLRKREFPVLFLLCEEMKEKASRRNK